MASMYVMPANELAPTIEIVSYLTKIFIQCARRVLFSLTHLSLGDVTVILKVQFLNLSYKRVAWALAMKLLGGMPHNLTNEKSTLVQAMAWCLQATSHYLSQRWPKSMPQNGITRSQWDKPVESLVFNNIVWYHIDDLAQERHNSIANALELHFSSTNPSICSITTLRVECMSYLNTHTHITPYLTLKGKLWNVYFEY